MYILLSNGAMKLNKSCSILQGAKMILGRGPLVPQKYRIFQKNIVILVVNDSYGEK